MRPLGIGWGQRGGECCLGGRRGLAPSERGGVGSGDKGGATGSGEGAGKGSPPRAPKASQRRNQLSDSPAPSVPADPFQNERGGLHICGRGAGQHGSAEQPCPARAAGSCGARWPGVGTPGGPWPRPAPLSGDANTRGRPPSVHTFIEGMGVLGGAPGACGERPAISLGGQQLAGSWRWVSKTCAETDKDRGECRPRALRPPLQGHMLRATGRGRGEA